MYLTADWNLTKLNAVEVLRFLGYRQGDPVPGAVLELVDEALAESHRWLQPRVVFADMPARCDQHTTVVRPPGRSARQWSSRGLAKALRGCKQATVLVATVGPEIEAETARSFRSDRFARATVIDALGTHAVQVLLEHALEQVRRRAEAAGFTLGQVFSPGYGDWDLETSQAELLELAGARRIGVELTEACMLNPQKSLTAIAGWMPPAWQAPRLEPQRLPAKPGCRACAMTGCAFREQP